MPSLPSFTTDCETSTLISCLSFLQPVLLVCLCMYEHVNVEFMAIHYFSERARAPGPVPHHCGRVGAAQGGVHPGGQTGHRLLRGRLPGKVEEPHQRCHQDPKEQW